MVLNCIESWKKYLPGYEIREWNEDNYDVTQVNFVKEAYENQKWAFVSDYVRFDVLYQFGGIYFDTDVELLKPIPEECSAKRAFTGFESTKLMHPGLVIGIDQRTESDFGDFGRISEILVSCRRQTVL